MAVQENCDILVGIGIRTRGGAFSIVVGSAGCPESDSVGAIASPVTGSPHSPGTWNVHHRSLAFIVWQRGRGCPRHMLLRSHGFTTCVSLPELGLWKTSPT